MIKWGILILYLLVMVGIGFYCNKKTKNVSDFVLGGRSIGPWFSAFAFGTSYFSAVVFIGYADEKRITSRRFVFSGNREEVRKQAVEEALKLILELN